MNEDGLYLKDFFITDEDIVSYFQNLSESENLEEKLLNLLKIGITVTKSISTAENVNYIEKAFENLDSDFSRKLNEAFGEKGQFSEVIKDHFGEDGKLIKEIFNPNREGSPLYILKKELDGNFYEIREKLGINKAVEKEKERGTRKGLDFEEECEKKLQWIARIHADKLEVTGTTKGKGGSMHIFDKEVGFVGGHGIVGGQIPLGAGLGFAEKYKGTDNLAICYIGDGAVRQGAFHETLNMAMTWKIPVIFVIENNQYAMGTSVKRTSNVTELYKLGLAYDMPSEPVDAMSVEEVHLAVERAAKRARSGEGPTLLEFNTYRYKGHSMSDPAKYRTKEELEEYKMQDPIEQVRAVILADKIATEAQLADIDKKIKERVLEAVKFAEESPFPGIEEIYTDIYDQTDYPFTQD